MSTSTFLSHLRGLSAYRDQIVHVEHIPTSEAAHGELSTSSPRRPSPRTSSAASGS
jgi:hypothetical protein